MSKPSIFEHDEQTIVAFGTGSILVGLATDSSGQVMIRLSDTLEEHEIGLDKTPWEDGKGRMVVLGFNNPKSLEVLAEAVKRAQLKFASQREPGGGRQG